MNRLAAAQDGARQSLAREQDRIERDLQRLVEAIKVGVAPTPH